MRKRIDLTSEELAVAVKNSDYISPRDIYARVGSEWEHYDRLIWQITGLAITITGAAVVAVYSISGNPLGRLLILGIGSWMLLTLAKSLRKHGYFSRMRSDTLQALEEDFSIDGKVVQRSTSPDLRAVEFYFRRVPSEADNFSALSVIIKNTTAMAILFAIGAAANGLCYIAERTDTGICVRVCEEISILD